MKSFTSRKSILLGAFLWGTLIITNGFSGGQLIMWILIYVFTGFIWFGLRYIFKDNTLIIRLGPIKMMSLKIEEIKSVRRSFNVISSPAASLKRLELDFKTGSVLISPKNEEEFIRHLKKSNPNIYVDVQRDSERSSLLTRFVYSLL